jgi:putative DNA primase/helicase
MTTPVDSLLSKLPDARRTGKGWLARCPAHEDRRASLSIAEGDDSRALVKCHAGCSVDAVCAAVGMSLMDLMPRVDMLAMPSKARSVGKPRIVALYAYRDETGKLLFQVVRFEPKDFRQRQPDGQTIQRADNGNVITSQDSPNGIAMETKWKWSVKGVRAIPYRLPELLADPTQTVFVVEGERDADNLAHIGLLATCNAGGAGKWIAEHSELLRSRHVVILPDNDEAGRNHAQQVAKSLHGIAERVRIVELPNLPSKGDASDWIEAGGTKAELTQIAESTPVWTPNAPEPWPEMNSFDTLNLPDFPTHVLPNVLREWVEAESHATQTPADLAGLLSLAVCAVCIARRLVVEPRPGWREPVNLFAAVLLEPGNRKSAVFGDAMKPLRELEADLIDAARPAVAKEQSDRRQDEARLRKFEKLAAEKGDAEARYEAGKLAAELAEKTEPTLPRLLVDDATAEKLGIMLSEQEGRIASMSPEGGVFDLMAGLYSKSGIPQFGVYLMGHSGDDLITDRVSRKGVRVERPALTCAYAMQPAVIEGLAGNAAFRGRGLLARFLYAAPKSWIGRREIATAPVPETTRDAYHQMVHNLAESEGEFVLQLEVDAAELLRVWEIEIEAMLGDGGQMEIMRDWGAKLAGATLRIAAILHCVEYGPIDRIERQALAAAIEIARYLIPHAEAVLNMMLASEETADDDAQYVLRWIERRRKTEFTKSEAQHHGKRRFPKANDIDAALAELTRRGYIRPKPTEASGPGRPPSPSYEINPAYFVDSKKENCPQNSRNSDG